MKFSVSGIVAATAALAAQGTSGHYIFQSLAAGSGKGTPYQYVRQNTNMNSPVLGKFFPQVQTKEGVGRSKQTKRRGFRQGEKKRWGGGRGRMEGSRKLGQPNR